jgi:hypothetical protein
MPELPRLDDLIRLSPQRGHNPYRVFNSYTGAIGKQGELQEKRYTLRLPSIAAFLLKPSRP